MDSTAIRTWARSAGYEIGDRGRIRDDIVRAYILANGAEDPPPAAPVRASPQPKADPANTVYVARPLATPGVAESYGPDPADVRGVAKAYVPDAGELTDALIEKAMRVHAAIVNVGGTLKLYKNAPVPEDGKVVLDWRE